MRLLVVNPNTSASMTAAHRRGGARRGGAGSRDRRGQSGDTVRPRSRAISTKSSPRRGWSRRSAKGDAAGFDAFIVACFDDTGLEAARCAARGPVIGIGEAAFHVASLIAHRFSVVTTLSRSIAPIEANLTKYGLASRCARVRACEVPVLALDDPASGAREKLSAEIDRAIAEDGAEAIVLGCAGMADLAAALARRHGLPVVDGVAAAVKLAEALVGLGLATSKRGPYAPPLPKPFTGAFAGLSR